MKITRCDKCGAESIDRNPGYMERFLSYNGEKRYVDLCPNCIKDYDAVVDAAEKTYQATIVAWLNCIYTEDRNDGMPVQTENDTFVPQ